MLRVGLTQWQILDTAAYGQGVASQLEGCKKSGRDRAGVREGSVGGKNIQDASTYTRTKVFWYKGQIHVRYSVGRSSNRMPHPLSLWRLTAGNLPAFKGLRRTFSCLVHSQIY